MTPRSSDSRSGLVFLLVVALLMSIGTFMVQPFIMLMLVEDKALGLVQASAVLATLLIAQQALPLMVGYLGERFGYGRLITLGLLLRALGYTVLALADRPALLFAAAAVAGAGGACYHTLIGAIIIERPQQERKTAVTWLNQMANLGAIIGPPIGSVVIGFGTSYIFLCAALVLLAGVILLLGGGAARGPAGAGQRIHPAQLLVVARDRRFMAFALLMITFWIMFTQLTVAFPIFIAAIAEHNAWAGLVGFVNGACCFGAMFLLRSLFRRKRPPQLISLGLLTMAASFFLVPLGPASPLWIIGCVALCAVGETLVLPAADLALGDYSERSGLRGWYFAFFEMSYAVGGTIGSFLGSSVLATSPAAIWMTLAAVGLAGAILLTVGAQRISPVQVSP